MSIEKQEQILKEVNTLRGRLTTASTLEQVKEVVGRYLEIVEEWLAEDVAANRGG